MFDCNTKVVDIEVSSTPTVPSEAPSNLKVNHRLSAMVNDSVLGRGQTDGTNLVTNPSTQQLRDRKLVASEFGDAKVDITSQFYTNQEELPAGNYGSTTVITVTAR